MTATEDPHAPAAQHDLHLPPGVEAIDPEHDINAKTTVIWLSSCLVFVIVCIWVLSQVFAFNLADQRMVKIDLAPAEELRQIRSDQDFWLRKAAPAGAADERPMQEIDASILASTDLVIERYLSK